MHHDNPHEYGMEPAKPRISYREHNALERTATQDYQSTPLTRPAELNIRTTTSGLRQSKVQEQMDVELPGMRKAMFLDMKEMKQKLRQNLHKPRYNVFDFYYQTGLCQHVARHTTFENITLAVIGLNALWLGVDTDANDAEVLIEAHPVFIVVENFFCGFFSVELCIRFGAFANKANCLKDAWFVFDFTLVSLMVFETWVMSLMIVMSGAGTEGGGVGNAGVLRLMRLMRLSRMARMARLLRAMPELLILIKGLVAATRAVCVTLVLLMLILYVFGIAFRQLTDETEVGEEFFPGVLSSMHSLIIFGIQFDGVLDMMVVVEEHSAYHLIILFYFFVLLATLTVLNMLIGVLCEVITTVANVEQEQIQVYYLTDNLMPIVRRCCEVEDLGPLKISREQFLEILCDPQSAPLLDMVGVDSFALVDLIDTLFTTPQGLPCKLTYDSFVGTILDQRSSNTAKLQDLTSMRKFLKARLDKIDFDIMAKVIAMGRLCERSLGLPKGTYQKNVDEARKNHVTCFQNPKGVTRGTIQSRATEIRRQTMACQQDPESLGSAMLKPWEIPMEQRLGNIPNTQLKDASHASATPTAPWLAPIANAQKAWPAARGTMDSQQSISVQNSLAAYQSPGSQPPPKKSITSPKRLESDRNDLPQRAPPSPEDLQAAKRSVHAAVGNQLARGVSVSFDLPDELPSPFQTPGSSACSNEGASSTGSTGERKMRMKKKPIKKAALVQSGAPQDIL